MRNSPRIKKSLLPSSLKWLLIIFFSLPVYTQDLTWDVNLSKPKTFTSLNPYDDPDVTVADMWHVSMKELMTIKRPNPDWNYIGIYGELYDKVKGYVKLSVYLYDDSPPDPGNPSAGKNGRGPLLFHCYMDKEDHLLGDNPRAYDLGNWLAWWPDAKENEGGFYFNEHWISTDAKSVALAAAFYNYNKKFGTWTRDERPGTAVIPYSQLPEGDLKLPVIIEVEVFKANVFEINIPGVGYIAPDYFKPPFLDIKATTRQVFTNVTNLSVEIPKPGNAVRISNIQINLSRFGDMESQPISSITIQNTALPYSSTVSLQNNSNPPDGEYWIWAVYDLEVHYPLGKSHIYRNRKQFLSNYSINVSANEFPRVYNVGVRNYLNLPVFTLHGGMSAEYGVEKSLASLTSGISETWDVRTKNGKPDLKDGGPVSVYPDPNKFDFLKNSVNETVRLYNNYLHAATPINTVIIGTGVAHVPYLSNAMKAPFLPLHFLVSVHSVAEVKRILDTAGSQGYSAFSMMGYDPSIDDIGVAWIKLRELPAAYIQFLKDHQVKNVIIMGYQQGVQSGESGARRIWIEGQQDADFSEGSMYMMGY